VDDSGCPGTITNLHDDEKNVKSTLDARLGRDGEGTAGVRALARLGGQAHRLEPATAHASCLVVSIKLGLKAVNKLPVNSQAHVATLLVEGKGLGSVNSKVMNGPVTVNVSEGLRISMIGIVDARLLVG
jgi:hypothetical protein